VSMAKGDRPQWLLDSLRPCGWQETGWVQIPSGKRALGPGFDPRCCSGHRAMQAAVAAAGIEPGGPWATELAELSAVVAADQLLEERGFDRRLWSKAIGAAAWRPSACLRLDPADARQRVELAGRAPGQRGPFWRQCEAVVQRATSPGEQADRLQESSALRGGRPQPVQRPAVSSHADASSRPLEPLANSSSYEAAGFQPGGKPGALAALLAMATAADGDGRWTRPSSQPIVSTCLALC